MKPLAGYLKPTTSVEEMQTYLQIQTQTLGREFQIFGRISETEISDRM